MKKLAVILALLPGLAIAECVLNDRTVSRTTATIVERSAIRPEVVPTIGAIKNAWSHCVCELVASGTVPLVNILGPVTDREKKPAPEQSKSQKMM